MQELNQWQQEFFNYLQSSNLPKFIIVCGRGNEGKSYFAKWLIRNHSDKFSLPNSNISKHYNSYTTIIEDIDDLDFNNSRNTIIFCNFLPNLSKLHKSTYCIYDINRNN